MDKGSPTPQVVVRGGRPVGPGLALQSDPEPRMERPGTVRVGVGLDVTGVLRGLESAGLDPLLPSDLWRRVAADVAPEILGRPLLPQTSVPVFPVLRDVPRGGHGTPSPGRPGSGSDPGWVEGVREKTSLLDPFVLPLAGPSSFSVCPCS